MYFYIFIKSGLFIFKEVFVCIWILNIFIVFVVVLGGGGRVDDGGDSNVGSCMYVW